MNFIPRVVVIAFGISASIIGGGFARADESDALRFQIGQSVTYDDNVFRLGDSLDASQSIGSSRRGDTISTTYLGLSFDKLISRQNLHASATWNINRFSHFSGLDYNGLRADANWGWQLGNYLKGTLSFERNRRLIDFGNLAPDDRGRLRDVNTYDRFYSSADWWFHPSYSVGVGYARVNSSYSSEFRQASEYDANVYELNGKFLPKTGNLIGVTLRRTEGKYPNRQLLFDNAGALLSVVDNGFAQTDAEVNGDWRLSGQSRVFGRLGYTKRKHDQIPERDFSGLTGKLTYSWALEGKSALNVVIRREIGAVDDLESSYVITNGISINPVWAPTSKLTLSGKYDWSRRKNEGEPSGFVSPVDSVPQRQDKINTASVTVSYTPLRNLQVDLAVQRENRTSNLRYVGYGDNVASLSARFSF